MKKRGIREGGTSQLHLRMLLLVLVLVLMLVLVLVLMLVLMMVMMFGTHCFRVAVGSMHHSHGDAVRLHVSMSVSVSRRIAVIRLQDSSRSGLSKLHLSSDGAL